MTAPVLSDALVRKDNAINLLRLILALAVVVSHAWPLGGFGKDPGRGTINLGQIAVGGFFLLSGWLITQSGERTSAGRFIWHRALRILPGFWVSLIVVALCYAPLAYYFAHHSLNGYATTPTTPVHQVLSDAAVRIRHYDIGDTLSGVPFPNAWNGSLHTLWQEIWCYALVGVLAVTGLLRRRKTLMIVGIVLYVLMMLQWRGHTLPGINVLHIVNGVEDTGYILAFVVGAILYQTAEYVPVSRAFAGGSILVMLISLTNNTAFIAVGFAGFAYTLFWLAVNLPGKPIGRKNDISYGIYIYAFPTEQLLSVVHWNRHGLVVYLITSLAGTAIVAWASWLGIEKPALALKGTKLRSS